MVGVPARAGEQEAQLLGDAAAGEQDGQRGERERGVREAETAVEHDREDQGAGDRGRADPVHAAAPGQHAAGDCAEPQQGEDVDALIAEADDEHGRQGDRLFDLLPLLAQDEELGKRGGQDEREGDQGQAWRGWPGAGWVRTSAIPPRPITQRETAAVRRARRTWADVSASGCTLRFSAIPGRAYRRPAVAWTGDGARIVGANVAARSRRLRADLPGCGCSRRCVSASSRCCGRA